MGYVKTINSYLCLDDANRVLYKNVANSLFSANPYYQKYTDRLRLRLGARIDVASKGTTFRIAPDVKFDYSFTDRVALALSATGGNHQNTLHEVIAHNRYAGCIQAIAPNSFTLIDSMAMQYINAGFNPLNEIAKKTGKSMAQLKDDVSKGLITFDMVQDAFRSATSEGGQFNNMLGKIAETPAGKMEQLKGAWEEMKIKAGEAFMPLLSAAMELVEKVMPMIETGIGKLAELVAPFVDKIKDGKEQFGGLMDYVNIVKDIVVNTIVPYFEKLWGIVSDIVVDIVEFVSQSEILKDAFKLIGEFAATVYDWISNILDAFSWLWNNVVMPLLEGLDKAYSAIKDLFGYGDKKGTSSGRKQVTAPKAVTTSDNETKTILNDIKTNTNQNTAATKDAVSAVKGGGQKVINIQIGKFFDNIQFQTTNLTESVEDIEQTVLECMGRVLLNGAVAGTQ